MIVRTDKSLGDIHYEKTEYGPAINYYTKEIEDNPNSVTAYNNRGRALLKLNKYENAILDFTEAIRIDSRDLFYRNRSVAYFLNGQYEFALQDIDVLLKLNPNDIDAYNKRGDTLKALHQEQLAKSCYIKAIKIHIEQTKSDDYLSRAKDYISLAQFERDVKFSYNEINIFIQSIATSYNTFSNYRPKDHEKDYAALTQYRYALEECNNAIGINPNDFSAYEMRAYIFVESIQPYISFLTLKNGHYGDLSPWYSLNDYLSKLKELIPNDPELTICNKVTWHGDYENAIKDYNEMIRIKPDNSNVYASRGIAQYRNDQYHLGLQDLNQAIEMDPCNACAYNDRGTIYGENYHLNNALKDLNKAIEIDPYYSIAYGNRGIFSAKKYQINFNLVIKDLPYIDEERREKILNEAFEVDKTLNKAAILQKAKIHRNLIDKYKINVEQIEALCTINNTVRIWLTQTWPQIITKKDVFGNPVRLNDEACFLPGDIWNYITKFMVEIEDIKKMNEVAHQIRKNGFSFFAQKKINVSEKPPIEKENDVETLTVIAPDEIILPCRLQ